jgi:hypothetical protein
LILCKASERLRRDIPRALPDWFGRPAVVEAYAGAVEPLTMFGFVIDARSSVSWH